jgi:hypothetical protein
MLLEDRALQLRTAAGQLLVRSDLEVWSSDSHSGHSGGKSARDPVPHRQSRPDRSWRSMVGNPTTPRALPLDRGLSGGVTKSGDRDPNCTPNLLRVANPLTKMCAPQAEPALRSNASAVPMSRRTS